jgi:hypothetical protein
LRAKIDIGPERTGPGAAIIGSATTTAGASSDCITTGCVTIGCIATGRCQGGGAPRAKIEGPVERAHPASVATARARARKRLDRMGTNPRLFAPPTRLINASHG